MSSCTSSHGSCAIILTSCRATPAIPCNGSCNFLRSPGDTERGENWDHVAFDPEHRLVVALVPGKRTAQNSRELVAQFRRWTGNRIMRLITSDEYPSGAPGH